MATIAFANIAEADARSAELWIAILGRDKLAQDITEYLYSRTVSEGGDIAIEIADRDTHLDALIRQDQMTADEIAALVDLYPAWSDASVAYATGDIVAYSGTLYRIITGHTSQVSWTPDATPALWEPCAPGGVIPEFVQPSGAHDSYALGDKVTYNGQVWESTFDGANVWPPGTGALWVLV